jgi:hypothetical protein
MLHEKIALILLHLMETLIMNKNVNPEITKFIISNIVSGNAYNDYVDAVTQAFQVYSMHNPNYKFAYIKYNYPDRLARLTEHVIRVGPETFHQLTTHPQRPMKVLTTYLHFPNTIYYISFKTQNSEVSVMPATEIEGNFTILSNTDLCLERRAKLAIYEEYFFNMAFIADLEQTLNTKRIKLLNKE